ncbi:hypothetical protein MRX96_001414 [Rhipicephalus microplus]
MALSNQDDVQTGPRRPMQATKGQLSTTLRAARNGMPGIRLGEMTATTARDEYVAFVSRLFPDWRPEEKKSSTKSMLGAVVSRPCWEPSVDPENKDAFDWTKEGCLERLAECLNTLSVHERDEQGMCMLHWACDRGHLEIVELLLDKGADPEAKDEEGQTPLHYASSCGHLQTPAEVALNPELEALLSPS